ncbi:hypothetical protein [Enterococcus sp. UD-01]|jgi:small multidrug resistance pump|uniref:hypothetical protein n=1 Tax=Enterococcus sp. UD-01 TaxID=3373911 RepID=UPI0038373926
MLLFLLYVVLSTSGLILVKLGSQATAIHFTNAVFSFSMSLTSIIGFVCYLFSFVLWMVIVSKSEVSYIVPLGVACTNIAVLLGSKLILQEQVSLGTVIGTGVIILGIVIIQLAK